MRLTQGWRLTQACWRDSGVWASVSVRSVWAGCLRIWYLSSLSQATYLARDIATTPSILKWRCKGFSEGLRCWNRPLLYLAFDQPFIIDFPYDCTACIAVHRIILYGTIFNCLVQHQRENTQPYRNVYQQSYLSYDEIRGFQGSFNTPPLRILPVISRFGTSISNGLTSSTNDCSGLNKMVSAFWYLAKDDTELVGSVNSQSSRKISVDMSPLSSTI